MSKIAKLKVNRAELDRQAQVLKSTNVVYQEAVYNEASVATWIPDLEDPQVPAPILESVVAVPCGEDPGTVVRAEELGS